MVFSFTKNHSYNHPWETVTMAFWKKYPNSEYSHVKEIDVYERKVDEKTGELMSKRLLTLERNVPAWLKSLGFGSTAVCHEESVVNAKEKTLTLRSYNLTTSSLLLTEEVCTYRPDPADANKTLYSQEVRVTANTPAFTSKLEKYVASRFSETFQKGLNVIEVLCQRENNP